MSKNIKYFFKTILVLTFIFSLTGFSNDYLKELGILLGGLSDCEELVGHQIEHLSINESNYFLY